MHLKKRRNNEYRKEGIKIERMRKKRKQRCREVKVGDFIVKTK
jgi:hypothetical protein